jgi:hypothetical protein
MKLLELFIIETTEEDRAIISLSSAVYKHIQKYADYIDPDNAEPLDVGKIDDFCTTPLEGIEDISIVLLQGDALRAKIKASRKAAAEQAGKNYVDDDPENIRHTLGLWDNTVPAIYLNADFITSNTIKSTIVHELRHALDDLKSSGKASSSDTYRTPRKKQHRIDDPYMGNLAYRAEPAEINARFAQVLHSVTLAIERAAMKDMPADSMQTHAMTTLRRALALHKISDLFPEKERSRDYKRLMKRAVDFINKELAYQKSTNSDL